MSYIGARPNQYGQTHVNVWAMIKALINNFTPILVNNGAPTNGAVGTGTYAGWAGPGAILIDNLTPGIYINTGTISNVTWTSLFPSAGSITPSELAPNVLQVASGTISSANLTGTSAGQFGHANGVVLVPPQGAHNVVELVSVLLAYEFATAAYTAGGNITVNNAAGGAAISGLVSAANSVGASANKTVLFVPLATAGIAIVENGGLNLVAASAFTNPGTAAGVINWIANYRVMATGLS
jgi:hypothetical protein